MARKKQERGDNETTATSQFIAYCVEGDDSPCILDLCYDVARTEAILSLAERPMLPEHLTIEADVDLDDSLDECMTQNHVVK